MRLVSLFIALMLFWLALSGHYTPFLIGAGVVCSLVCVAAAVRMDASDREGHPLQLFARAPAYYAWLVWEIVNSGWAVTRIVIDPRLPISPTMTRVRASQRSAAGLATYANSITLTPGTITTAVEGGVLTVHALVREGAIDVEGGAMDRRVAKFEGAA